MSEISPSPDEESSEDTRPPHAEAPLNPNGIQMFMAPTQWQHKLGHTVSEDNCHTQTPIPGGTDTQSTESSYRPPIEEEQDPTFVLVEGNGPVPRAGQNNDDSSGGDAPTPNRRSVE